MRRRLCALLPWGLLLVTLAAVAQPDALPHALHDEMQRSMERLQMEQLEKPYFISYQVIDEDVVRASATLGSALAGDRSRVRVLLVSVRVGDYDLDNSTYVPGTPLFSVRSVARATLPLDDDYQELRRQIWLATDSAYKGALEDLTVKRAALENSDPAEHLPAFYHVTPAMVSDLAPPLALDLDGAVRLVREASALFRQTPQILSSEVRLLEVNQLQTYLNSEGSQYTVRTPQIELRVEAQTEAADGRPLADQRTVFARRMQELPAMPALAAQIRTLQEGLEHLRTAPLSERYEGPVLFEGQAAGELFVTHFAQNLPAAPAMAGRLLVPGQQGAGSDLLRRIGFRVLPAFLDVVDDPTATAADGSPLLGGYKVDSEGVPAQRTLVVQAGVLETVLTSREPVAGVAASTGNMRMSIAAASNLLVTTRSSLSPEELRRQLVLLAQSQGAAYGVVIRRLSGSRATLAYRVYPDGHEELERNALLEGVAAGDLSRIVAVSRDREVYTREIQPSALFVRFLGAAAPLQSCAVPSLLITGLTLDRPQGPGPKPVLIPSPLEAAR